MSQPRPTTRWTRLILLAASVVVAVVAMPSVSPAPSAAPQGQQPAAMAAQASTPKAPAATQVVRVPARAEDAGQRAFIDPKTGKLREPEPEEIAALKPSAAVTSPGTLAAAVEFKEGPGGAVGMVVPEELLSYSVATINPDGTVSTACVDGKKAAEAAVRAPKPTQAGARKEHDHDR